MKYGITTLIVVFLLIIGVVVLIGRDNGDRNQQNASETVKLAEYDNSDTATINWVQQGRVVGEDQYNAIRITITKNKRTAEVLSGYGNHVEKTTEFTNTQEAFATFTRALDNLSFTVIRDATPSDERGVCPQGNRFIYQAADGTKQLVDSWSTTCSTSQGTYGGRNASATRSLFTQQITDYNTFVSGVTL